MSGQARRIGNRSYQVRQYVIKPCDKHVRILSDPRPHVNTSEADEETDGRFRLQIARAIADERRLSLRPRTNVANDDLFAARSRERRVPIEIVIFARV